MIDDNHAAPYCCVMFNITTENGEMLRCGLTGLYSTLNDFTETGTKAWVSGFQPRLWQTLAAIAVAILLAKLL